MNTYYGADHAYISTLCTWTVIDMIPATYRTEGVTSAMYQFILPLFYAGFVSEAGMQYALSVYMVNHTELIP